MFEILIRRTDGKKVPRALLSLMLLILGSSCLFACTPPPPAYGILEGQVTIGPLVPIIREGEVAPTPAPEVYASRAVVVYHQDGKTEFARIQIESDGTYRAELPVGTYVVDILSLGIDRAEGLPKEIEITAQSVTRLDIDIDTGIR